VLTIHWQGRPITSPAQVEPASAPRRRLFHLEMLERGYYVAQRGMIALSLPTQESDLSGFVQATRDYLIRHTRDLRLV
jgi:glutamate-1-semialdehyde 2,1-aminomutase